MTIDSNEVNSGLIWTPPGEIVVGGVYLKLFVANPQWALRSPRTFLADLLDTILAGLQKDGQVYFPMFKFFKSSKQIELIM